MLSKDNFDRYVELMAEYDGHKATVQRNPNLSAEGKKADLRDLSKFYLTRVEGILSSIDDQAEGLAGRIRQIETQAPGIENLSEQQILSEQRQVNLLVGELTAAGKDGFLEVAKAAATCKPGVFRVAFSQISNHADKLFPGSVSSDQGYDPWKQDADQQGKSADARERAYVRAELQSLYEKAVRAAASPDDVKREQEIEFLKGQQADLSSDRARISRHLRRSGLEQAVAPSSENLLAGKGN